MIHDPDCILPYRVEVKWETDAEIDAITLWCEREIGVSCYPIRSRPNLAPNGKWGHHVWNDGKFFFLNYEDALRFSLRWS